MLSGCENPGSVGGGLTDSEADVVIDTLAIQNLSGRSYQSYSGGFNYFSAGQYEDPLWGKMTAVGLVKPGLPGSNSDTVTADSKMKMRIIINSGQVYGDTTAPQQFDLYEIDELWRAKAWKLYDDVSADSTRKIASFTLEEGDSLDVELPQEWVDKYRQYVDTTNGDSLYRYNMHGLALVPTNSHKIIPLDASSTRFVIENPEADTFAVESSQWAYSLRRGNSDLPENSLPLLNTLEDVLQFRMDLSDLNVAPAGVSKGELILYQNNEALEQSLQSQPPTVQRPQPTSAQLHLVNPEQTPLNLEPGNPIATGTYSADEGAFRFNVTSVVQNILVNGMPENQDFFVTFSQNGVIMPSLIYTGQGPDAKTPKLIITSLKNSNN